MNRQQVQEMADRLINTLDSSMDAEKADAIVRDVAEGLYNDVLGIRGSIVIDKDKPQAIVHGGFGPNGRRGAMQLLSFKFQADAQQDISQLPAGDYVHWVVADKKGKVDVFHVSECAGGESCELFQYLSEGENMEKQLKRGHEYNVRKNAAGAYVFEDTGTSDEKEKLQGVKS